MHIVQAQTLINNLVLQLILMNKILSDMQNVLNKPSVSEAVDKALLDTYYKKLTLASVGISDKLVDALESIVEIKPELQLSEDA